MGKIALIDRLLQRSQNGWSKCVWWYPNALNGTQMRFDHPFCERCSYLSTKADADTRAQYLKKKKSILENPEFDNQAFQESLQEAIEKNNRLNLLKRVFK